MKPTPAPYQGQAWPQHAVPGEISVRHGTVAVPALTSASKDRILRPRRLVCMTFGRRVPPASGIPKDGKCATSRTRRESAPESRPSPPPGPTRH